MMTESLSSSPQSLDELASLSASELAVIYQRAKTPRVEDLDGRVRGRMLAIPVIESVPVLPWLLRHYAASRFFPWQGKTFRTLSHNTGEAINHFLGDRFECYRLKTFVGHSNVGDFEAVHFDHDNPRNPFFIRIIKDEVREVAPGLWLGLSFLKLGRLFVFALYFALSKR